MEEVWSAVRGAAMPGAGDGSGMTITADGVGR